MACVQVGAHGLQDVLGTSTHAAAPAGVTATSRLDVCRDARGFTYCPGALSVRVSTASDCSRLCRVLYERMRSAESSGTVMITCESRQRGTPQAPVAVKFVVAFLACEPMPSGSNLANPATLAWHAVKDCVEALRVGNPYVPYRRSTVTYFLQVGVSACGWVAWSVAPQLLHLLLLRLLLLLLRTHAA